MEDDVEAKILAYPHLSDEEQQAVESYVESNPEWSSLLQDVRALEQLAPVDDVELPSEGILATYATLRYLHPDEIPPSLEELFSRVEARIEAEPDLRRRVAAIRQRLQETEAAIDPIRHFEELTGHTLETDAEPATADVASADHSEPAAGSVLETLFAFPLWLQRGAVAAVLLIGLYGGLYGISVATQSQLDRLAAVEVSDQVIDSYATTQTRDAVQEPDTASADQLYLEALSTLRAARSSTLGLFPRYNSQKLAGSETLFTKVLHRVEPGSFLALETRFYLGKIALARGNVSEAQTHFKTVVKEQGRKMDEAFEILKALQQDVASETETDG